MPNSKPIFLTIKVISGSSSLSLYEPPWNTSLGIMSVVYLTTSHHKETWCQGVKSLLVGSQIGFAEISSSILIMEAGTNMTKM